MYSQCKCVKWHMSFVVHQGCLNGTHMAGLLQVEAAAGSAQATAAAVILQEISIAGARRV